MHSSDWPCHTVPAADEFLEEGEGVLESIEVRNFTVFREARLEFARGLNVIVGENATGKTHLLKLPYSVFAVQHTVDRSVAVAAVSSGRIPASIDRRGREEISAPSRT